MLLIRAFLEGDSIEVGIVLAICAASLGTIGKQLLACSGQPGSSRWLACAGAFINMVVGPIVDALSYMFAPQVVVAPFACLDVILNLITAPVTLAFQKERLTRRHVLGTLLVAIGSVSTSIFGAIEVGDLDVYQLEAQLTRPESLAYMGCEVAIIGWLSACLQLGLLPLKLRGISMGAIAGMLMGNVFCTKGLMSLLKATITGDHYDPDSWLRPTPYVLILVSLGGSLVGNALMTKGLQQHKGVFMVTIFEGSHISAACISGAIVMSELRHSCWRDYIFYWMGVGLIISGMLVINASALDEMADEKLLPRRVTQYSLGDSCDNSPSGRTADDNSPTHVMVEPLLNGLGENGAVT